MYLRRVMFRDGYHYSIRSSYREGECWKSRELLDLGTDPAGYIEYVGGNGFIFKPQLEEKLLAQGLTFSTEDLEDLFLPFLRPSVRRLIEGFQARAKSSMSQSACSTREFAQRQRHLHSFDKRRLHFLRCGRVDIGDLDGRPWKFLRVIMEKSRDEIEHVIEGMESVLRPHEMRPYLFTALHLQAGFPDHPFRNHPAALNQDTVDDHFLMALCSLNDDDSYFAGMKSFERATLHPFLVKYLILYFDSESAGDFRPEQFRDYAFRQRFSSSRPPVRRMDLEDACRIFGVSRAQMMNTDRKELVRLYRRKAKEVHPDCGGDQEAFIRMKEAFACLMEGK